MSISNVTYKPHPPKPGQPVTVTFETPQSMVPIPDVRIKIGREQAVPVAVTRTKDNKWQFTVTASNLATQSVTIVQGTMVKIISI
ncbi:MAG: hypothetical protein EXS14_08450 [Planctomycetes bacterium]|nr:hypothetical protein [Planctomycetota bacterium]